VGATADLVVGIWGFPAVGSVTVTKQHRTVDPPGTPAGGGAGTLQTVSGPDLAGGEPLPVEPTPAHTPASSERLLRSSAIVSVGTALSRVTGLVRTVAIAFALTAGLADAYNLANTAPNVVYDLILGGVLAATLVPVLVSVTDRGDRDAVRAVVTTVTVALVVLTVVAFAAAPGIVRLYTFTLDDTTRAAQESVAVPLLRLFLPQVLFYGLTALYSALLNARRRFAAAAFAPALNNIVVIAVLLAVRQIAGGEPTVDGVLADPALLWLLGAGTTAGIAAMALVLVPVLRSAEVPLGWNLDWRNQAVRRIVRLSGWTLGYVVVNQLGLVVLLALANSSAPEGSLSAYSYAYLFFQMPYGLFAVAVMTAFLPELSSAAERGDVATFRDRFGIGLRLILVVLLPAAVLYVTLGGQFVEVLFERGNFTSISAQLTTEALQVFGLALPGFAVFLYAMRGFYARTDTRTPFIISTGKIAAMVLIAWPLAARFQLGGVVAAFALAYTAAAVVSLFMLRRAAGGIAAPGTAWAMGRTGLAAAAMFVVALLVPRGLVGDGIGAALADVAIVGAASGLTYLAVLALVRSPDLAWVVHRIRPPGNHLTTNDSSDSGVGNGPGR
jgi:putative peptidoglycan lipid II flippase